jgi:hypothetical protein
MEGSDEMEFSSTISTGKIISSAWLIRPSIFARFVCDFAHLARGGQVLHPLFGGGRADAVVRIYQ